MSCDVGEVQESLENELCCISLSMSSAHSPNFPSLHLHHNSFSNPSIALTTSQLILQPFRCFTYVTVFSNHSFASPTSQALHLIHPASRPWSEQKVQVSVDKRIIIKFLTMNGSNYRKFLQRLEKQFGEACLSRTRVCEWFETFRERERERVENTPYNR